MFMLSGSISHKIRLACLAKLCPPMNDSIDQHLSNSIRICHSLEHNPKPQEVLLILGHVNLMNMIIRSLLMN